MVKDKKLIKEFEIGELNFAIGLNRSMAVDAISQNKDYWVTATAINELRDKIAIAQNVKDADKINFNKLSVDETLEMMRYESKLSASTSAIINKLLPAMLEYAETPLPSDIASYEEYAEHIINYCDSEGILENYQEKGKGVILGFYENAMAVVLQAFTNGVDRKTPRIKVVMK